MLIDKRKNHSSLDIDRKHKFLGGMLKEIDQICHDHNIEYYLVAGTMLGAIRHKDFIPWDDDADIVMTKENFDKFASVCQAEAFTDRSFQCTDNNPNFHMTIGRYYDTSTTCIQRSSAWDTTPIGQYVDVFMLIPVPSESKEQNKYVDWIRAYIELNNDKYVSYFKNDKSFYRKFFLSYYASKIFGRNRVLNYIRKKYFSYPDELCDEYMASLSTLSGSRIYKKELFSKQTYVDFQDYKLPVSSKYKEIIWDGYGMGWFWLPEEHEQITHVLIDDFSRTYKYYTSDYMRFVDRNTVLKDISKLKINYIRSIPRKDKSTKSMIDLKNIEISLKYQMQVDKGKINLKEKIKHNEFDDLYSFFDDYYKRELYAGRAFSDTYIEIPEDILYAALLTLTAKGKYYKAYSVLMRYMKDNELNEDLNNLLVMITEIANMYKAYDYGKLDEMKIIINKWKNKAPYQIDFLIEGLHIQSLEATSKDEYVELKINAKELLKKFPGNGDCTKYLADAYDGLRKYKIAKEYYHEAEKTSQNGWVLQDIKKKLESYD